MTKPQRALKNFEVFGLAWRIAGGTKALLKGVDFKLALLLTAVCAPSWLSDGWWEQTLSVLPNLLGFTLGGFAIFLGFGSDQFQKEIADEEEHKSLYLSVSAAFLLFVLFQVAALLYALVAKALWQPTPAILSFAKPFFIGYGNYICWGVGYFLFLYSIILSLRAAARIFRVSRWYNHFLVVEMRESEGISGRDGAPHQ